MASSTTPPGARPSRDHHAGSRIHQPGLTSTGQQPRARLIDQELIEQLETAGGIPGRLRPKWARRRQGLATIGNKNCRHERLTYGELADAIDEFAAGLLDLGCAPKDHVGLVAENGDQWLIADLALMSLAAVDVPRGGDAPTDEVEFCLTHGRCKAAIVEKAAHVDKLGSARAKLDWVVVMKGDAPDGTVSWDEVLEKGRARLATDPECIAQRVERVVASDLATIIYTSGTTGNPKGVMLTHANILHNVVALPEVVEFREHERFLSFLPSWHSFERAVEYIVLDQGLELYYSSKWTLKDDFKKISPQFVAGVPRVWETFYTAVVGGIEKKPPVVRGPIKALLGGSERFTRARAALRGWRLGDGGHIRSAGPWGGLIAALGWVVFGIPHLLADALVYRKLRHALGGEVGAAVSGGGPLPAHVDEFLNRAGIPLLNGYGLTESSPVISVRRANRNILGTIGRPVPMTEVRIVDDDGNDVGVGARGVIQARGPQIMLGYYENPTASSTALPGDGWLDTGDVGMLSNQGDVLITGRAKDTIVLSGGENVEPEPIETALCSSPVIAEALLVGHGQKTLGVLLVPEPDAVRAAIPLDKKTDYPELAANEDVRTHLKSEVGRLISRQRGYRNFERIGQVHVLAAPFSIDDGTLTATMKKRRHIIERKHADLITALFDD